MPDLVLSDLGSELRCKVIDGVSDHNAILGTVAFGVPQFMRYSVNISTTSVLRGTKYAKSLRLHSGTKSLQLSTVTRQRGFWRTESRK